jgi:diguanylate cyclase (GGDEF)-like protein
VVTAITKKDGLPNVFSNGMFESKDNSIWLGIDGGLTRYQKGRFTQYTADGRFSKYNISAISEDDEGLIVATSETLAFRFQDGHVRPFSIRGKTTPLSTPGNYTFTIYRDPAGTLWFGTVHGLFRFSPGDAPENAQRRNVDFPVTTIFDDGHGSLWLGGRVPGITQFRLRDGRVTRFTESSGLFDDYPSCILTDNDGNFWISTSSGIYMASAKALDDFAEGRASTVPSTRYGTPDGMKTSEASPPLSQPGGWRTQDGDMWFGTPKGVVVVDPRHLLHNRLVAPVVVEEVVADGKTVSGRKDLRLSPGTGRIEIHYTSLSLLVPTRVRFQYKLEGYDRTWVDAGASRVASYTNLAPARYRFRVIATNNDGVWNDEGAAIAFELLPHFYQTAWFYTLAGLAIAVFACGFYLLRVEYLVRRNQDLEEKVALRTAELETEKAELLLAREQLQRLATRDGLTGVWNRAAIFELLTSALDRCARGGNPVSVIMCDLDEFKQINDRYGHPAGDLALKEAVRRFQTGLRTSDFVGRYGGEEFLIVLPDCSGAEARSRAEQLCRSIEAHPLEVAQESIAMTCSFGVSSSREGAYGTENLVREADRALYRAKRAGKNRTEFQEPVGAGFPPA